MPLLDSFTVDHTRMGAPAVRVAKTMHTPHGDTITVFDLRFCIPNKEVMPEKGIHTLEHLFAGFMRDHLNGNGVEIIDISPMGCRTGFYMSLIGVPDETRVADAHPLDRAYLLHTHRAKLLQCRNAGSRESLDAHRAHPRNRRQPSGGGRRFRGAPCRGGLGIDSLIGAATLAAPAVLTDSSLALHVTSPFRVDRQPPGAARTCA